MLSYLVAWPLWVAAAPAYERFLAAAANAIHPGMAREAREHRVTLVDRDFYVHLWAKVPRTGINIDARGVHFNWLILVPLLVATRAVGRGVPGPLGTARARWGLVIVHIGFLLAVAEYRMLRHAQAQPDLRSALRMFSYFYYAVGRVGLAVLIWMPIGLRALKVVSTSRAANP